MEQVVTKEKHPGRAASGKRLVEWNRNNKKSFRNLKKRDLRNLLNLLRKSLKSPQVRLYTLVVVPSLLLSVQQQCGTFCAKR